MVDGQQSTTAHAEIDTVDCGLWSVETGIDRNAVVENVTVRWTQYKYYYSIAQAASHAPSHLALILSRLTVHHTTVLTNLYYR